MKIQIQSGQWRLRVDEDELLELLAGKDLGSHCELPGDQHLGFNLRLVPGDAAHVQRTRDLWRINLSQAPVAALQARLPDRAGVTFDLTTVSGAPFQLCLQVDVKDSLKRRRPDRNKPG